MAPLITLVTVTLICRVVGSLGLSYVSTWPNATAVGLAVMFVMTGTAHFVEPKRSQFIAMVPEPLPGPLLVAITGVLEIVAAVALLTPPALIPVRQAAAWSSAALLIALFPANVHAAQMGPESGVPHTDLWVRTPIQAVFIAAALVIAFGGQADQAG